MFTEEIKKILVFIALDLVSIPLFDFSIDQKSSVFFLLADFTDFADFR